MRMREGETRIRRANRWLGRRVRIWWFNRRSLARLLGREHVLCLGDSHLKVMRDVQLPNVSFRTCGVGGATASGILNLNSKSRAAAIFKKRLGRTGRWQRVLLLLGEIDCGFLIWQRAELHGISVDEQLTQTLDAYEAFITDLVQSGFKEVIVLSPPLPTIDDETKKIGISKVARERISIAATQRERTQLTLRFTTELRELCARIGVTFLDVTSAQLDESSGLIRSDYLHHNPRDHHLASEPYSQLIAHQLQTVLSLDADGGVLESAALEDVGDGA
jgi:hypothetical protein